MYIFHQYTLYIPTCDISVSHIKLILFMDICLSIVSVMQTHSLICTSPYMSHEGLSSKDAILFFTINMVRNISQCGL